MTDELKTPRDWERSMRMPFRVLDPDGWRFSCGNLAPRSFDDPISLDEYKVRKGPSTVGPARWFV